MSRPPSTGKALRLCPLVQASGAYASRFESVPRMAADARPVVVFAGRPAAERTPYARAGSIAALVDGFAFDYRECRAHVCHIMTQSA